MVAFSATVKGVMTQVFAEVRVRMRFFPQCALRAGLSVLAVVNLFLQGHSNGAELSVGNRAV